MPPVPGGVDPARLYSALLNTGLQTKDNPLYQVIYQLIGQVVKLSITPKGFSGGGSGSGNGITNITQVIQQLSLDGGNDGGHYGNDNEIFAYSSPSSGGGGIDTDDMVPYYIAPGETFTIPEYKQALFAMNIDNEGILEIDGFLIEVDADTGGGGSSAWGGITGTLADQTDLDTALDAKAELNAANIFSSAGNQFQELLAVSKGLSFPATQVSSAGANDLDDYEEGNWTPVIGGSGGQSGQTYLRQIGRYVKIGCLCFCECYVSLSAKGTITGVVQIKGFPFTHRNVTNLFSCGNFQWYTLATNWAYITGDFYPGVSVCTLFAQTAPSPTLATTLATADITNTSEFVIGTCYVTET